MLIRQREVEQLTSQVRQIIDGKDLDLRNNKEGALSILRDEIYVLARQKNEQAGAFKHDSTMLTDMLADISHQLITPLTSALIMIELLEDSPADSPDKDAFIKDIKLSIQGAAWLTTSLLSMAKMEAGVVEFMPTPVFASDLTQKALGPVRAIADIKGISIQTAGDDPSLNCDVHWTAEALMNIINNAIRHVPDNSTITIESGENPICTWISVIDEGPGFTKAQIADAFKRFEKSDASTGYGIGLPFALKIIRAQNGDILIENKEPKQGAIVTVKFFKNSNSSI